MKLIIKIKPEKIRMD